MPGLAVPVALLALGGAAHAQSVVSELGPAVQLPTSGAWVRALPDGEGGWLLGIATQRGYGMIPMTSTGSGPSDWTVAEADRWWLVEQDSPQLDDHNLVACPDGSWLHVATGTSARQDDSAWWFRHSATWETTASGEVEVASPNMHHSDPPVMCSGLAQGVLVGPQEGHSGDTVFMEIGDSGPATVVATLVQRPDPVGGAIFGDDATGTIHRIGTDGPAGPILRTTYDGDWNELSASTEEPLTEPYMVYWPQGRMRVGDHYLLATLGNPERGGGGNRTRPFLVVYDLDWNHVETIDLVPDGSADGAARPWISRQGDLILLSWDASLKPYVMGIRIDRDVTGDDPEPGEADGGGSDGAGAADDTGGDAKDGGCGCGAAAAPAGGLAWLGALALVGWRRRS